MQKRDPVAFLSYVRSDDDHDQGNISKIRERLEGELKVQSGRSFPIFQDRNDIKWGQQWQARIEESILGVTFLIPVLTPSFFNSPACRSEFNAFYLKEKQYGFNHLILPIYYVQCDELGQDFPKAKDTIADVLRSRQWCDWRPLRFRQLMEPEAASMVAKMASDIKMAMGALEVQLDAECTSRKAKTVRSKKNSSPASSSEEPDGETALVSPVEPFSYELALVKNGIGPLKVDRLKQMWRKPYYAYTSRFDEVVPATELANVEELFNLQNFLNRYIERTKFIRPCEGDRFSNRCAVTLLLDNSGSLRGGPIMSLAACTSLLMEWLEHKGAAVEVLGFTTRAWKGGQSREMWLQDGKPKQPGRLNDLRHIIYKSFDDSVRDAYVSLALMLREGLLKENIDGESILWAYSRISQQDADRKLIAIFSDGAPVDDSTLSVNRTTILEEHQKFAIDYVLRQGVEILLIGPEKLNHKKKTAMVAKAFGGISRDIGRIAQKIEGVLSC